jgi:hypothetical protein
MPSDVKLYRVLIASPSDVAEERQIIREEVERWNSLHSESTKIVLQATGWETDSTPDLAERGQAIINRQLVDTCDFLIGVFWTRLGTPTPEAESGTVEEIERCINEGKRCIVYFSDKKQQPSQLDQNQYQQLKKYREALQKKGLVRNFKTSDEFQKLVFNHITSAIQDITKAALEQLAIEKTAKNVEQALNLHPSEYKVSAVSELSFGTLLDAQLSVKEILKSQFGIQELEDIKDKEIANIKATLASPELATLLSTGQPTAEIIRTFTQTLETVTAPSMYITSAICKYGNDTLPELRGLIVDWIERLTKREYYNYGWVDQIKTYPGLLLLYAIGLTALRSTKTLFLKEVTECSLYFRGNDTEYDLLTELDPREVFKNDIGQLLEDSTSKRFTPVNDYLTHTIKSRLYPNEDIDLYTDWFDCFEVLLSIKSVQIQAIRLKNNLSSYAYIYPYLGSFVWRTDGRRKVITTIQDAAIGDNLHGIAVRKLFGDINHFLSLATTYDEIASQNPFSFGRASFPTWIRFLVESASTQRIGTVRELYEALPQKRR